MKQDTTKKTRGKEIGEGKPNSADTGNPKQEKKDKYPVILQKIYSIKTSPNLPVTITAQHITKKPNTIF